MTFHKQQQGFTLIELLVVVAIIGILSSIVLAAVGTARQRARETAGQGTLSQVRAQAELDDDFDNVCSMQLIVDAVRQAGLDAESDTCFDHASGYAVSIPIGDNGFCVDSNGYAGEGVAQDGTPPQCTQI